MDHFRMTAHIMAPVGCWGDRPTLDSLLAYAWHTERGYRALTKADVPTDPPAEEFPLAVVESNVSAGLWWWDATAGAGDVLAQGERRRRKKLDTGAAHRHTVKRSVNTAAGLLKGQDLPTATLLIPEMRFWGHGDAAECLRLLDEYVTGIGSGRGRGLGTVQRWESEVLDEATWHGEIIAAFGDTVPRALPYGETRLQGVPKRCRLRPPAWSRHGAVMCVCPMPLEMD